MVDEPRQLLGRPFFFPGGNFATQDFRIECFWIPRINLPEDWRQSSTPRIELERFRLSARPLRQVSSNKGPCTLTHRRSATLQAPLSKSMSVWMHGLQCRPSLKEKNVFQKTTSSENMQGSRNGHCLDGMRIRMKSWKNIHQKQLDLAPRAYR
ncbi:hypothetical protein EV356DRAFT_341865 [Viridothelium virens]|uniref:Uncharacterized protein n=1 Tax=Viridothelium virens TaxID=1048519 RepID=A0A6A6GXV9_VIRVR|nr:hypothetical protein EV356DRAFT_341865 [Viridothelium virens]